MVRWFVSHNFYPIKRELTHVSMSFRFWVTRPEHPKGAMDEVKEAQRAAKKKLGPEEPLNFWYFHILFLKMLSQPISVSPGLKTRQHSSPSIHKVLGVPPRSKSVVFFEHCSKGGGGSNPCSKILEQILYDFKGILATQN